MGEGSINKGCGGQEWTEGGELQAKSEQRAGVRVRATGQENVEVEMGKRGNTAERSAPG